VAWLFPICGNRKRSGPCNTEKMWSSIFGDETVVAGTHDRELRPAAPARAAILTLIATKFMHHNRVMMDELKLD